MAMWPRRGCGSSGWSRRCGRVAMCWRSRVARASGRRRWRVGHQTVRAIDAAPQMIAIAREGVDSPNVMFEVADVFTWATSARFDVIFFSTWLSHVPTSRFEQFWGLLRPLLADRGRVLFIDEHIDERGKEAYGAGATEIVERRLGDGSEFRIVKNFVDPEQLTARLGQLGWECRVDRDGQDWVIGEAQPVR